MLKPYRRFAVACAVSLVIAATACTTALITGPIVMRKADLSITLTRLAKGPNQYNTAGGYWQPKPRRKFLWATFAIRNGGKAEQVVRLEHFILHIGSKQVKPFIIDMDSAVTVKANPEPRLAAGESVSRKIIYVILDSETPEKLSYEKDVIPIPPPR